MVRFSGVCLAIVSILYVSIRRAWILVFGANAFKVFIRNFGFCGRKRQVNDISIKFK